MLSLEAVRPLHPVAPPARPEPEEAVSLVLATLDDMKAEAPLAIDLRGKTSICDHMVIATGRSDRHVGAIAERLLEALKAAGLRGLRVEGMPLNDWVLIDTGDVIVHVFRPEVRAFYNLEKMWGAGRPLERVAG